ncbi:MAG: hypothetical protein JRJ85_05210 [Deltaproteobacteria bacterium]|nr:hypothetical protein [Deltaproteobacteria bacterium]
MRYRLCYKHINIGIVEQKDSDFPNMLGDFQYSLSFHNSSDPLLERLREFVRIAQQEADLAVRESDEENEDEWNQLALEQEKYRDLIESDDWYLINIDTNEKEPILSPLLNRDGTIIWRWYRYIGEDRS